MSKSRNKAKAIAPVPEAKAQEADTFEALAAKLRGLMAAHDDNDFKVALTKAVQRLETDMPQYALQSLEVLNACAELYYAGNDEGARLLMYLAGLVTNPSACGAVYETLVSTTRVEA